MTHRSQVTHLSVQSDGTGLALGADPLWPGRVALTARLDLTADVLQSCKLPSAGERQCWDGPECVDFHQRNGKHSLISSTSQLAKVCVE